MAQQKNSIKSHGRVKLVDVPCFLAKYQDGHGKEEVRIGFVVGQEVRFLKDSVLSNPAQSWLQNDILVALGLKEEVEEKTPGNLNAEENTGGTGLDTQV